MAMAMIFLMQNVLLKLKHKEMDNLGVPDKLGGEKLSEI